MLKKLISTAAVSALLVGNALATPVYEGNTFADFGATPSLPIETGYYIWSNEEQTEWSVRWTGSNNGKTEWGNWYGSIEFGGLSVDSVTPVMFEASHSDNVDHYDLSFYGLGELIAFQGYAGPLWDGFDFTLDKAIYGEVIGFNLGYTGFDFSGNKLQEGVGIFIGQDYATPQVLVQQANGTATQNFEVKVPEPSSLAIFAIGLIGLSMARRRFQQN